MRSIHWPVVFALLTAIAGTALSLLLHSRIVRTEETAAELTADALRLHIEQELSLFVEALESTPLLLTFKAANYNQEIISEFIEKGMPLQHAVLGTFGLAQRIGQQTRIQTEILNQTQPDQGYRVVHKGMKDAWVPAKNQPYYYPLFFQNKAMALQVPTGFDFSSIQSAYRIILQAEQSRQTITDPSPTFFSTAETPSYWVFAPFSDPYDPHSTTAGGVAIAIFHPADILQKISALSAPSSKLRLIPSASAPQTNARMADQAWIIQQPIHAMGTDWLFECTLPAAAGERRSTLALLFGLTVTALMTGLLLVLAGRTRRIEAEVLTRTEELRVANRQLEQNIRERAEMEEELNELSAREQRRIGRDLHDSLGQKLTGAAFLSRALFNHFKNDDGELHTHAKTLNETLKSAVAQVRQMARGLASVTLNDESLEESLHQLAEEMSALYDTPCTVSQQGLLPDLSRKTKEQLYFIAREAVNNAARHANPKKIEVRFMGNGTDWSLQIQDDGCGLPETRNSEGMGLRIMRHRAARIRAELVIESTPSNGTLITVQPKQ